MGMNSATTASAQPSMMELVLRWQGRVVDVKRFKDGTPVTIGAPASGQGDVDLFVPLEGGGVHALFGNGGALAVPAGVGVNAAEDGGVVLDFGLHTLQLRRAPKEKDGDGRAFFDAFWANVMVVVLLGGTAVMSALFLMPADVDALDDDLLANPTRFQTLVLAPKPKDNAFLEKMKAPLEQKKTEAKKKKEATQTAATTTPAKKSKKSDAQVVNDRLESLFGKGASGVGSVFHDSDDGLLTAAIASLKADRVAANGSLTVKGRPGEGGVPTGTLSTGNIETRRKGTNGEEWGATDAILVGKEDHEINVVEQLEPRVTGALDKEIIRRVVQEHASQVRYCYEKELNLSPGLWGKISIRWMIGPDGKVKSAAIAESSMHSNAVETCLTNRVLGWTFPSPKGGGSVVVNYPFVFKKSG